MKGKSVVITGASSGIGRRLAIDLAARQTRLVLAARNRQKLEALAQELGGDNGQVIAQPTDVTQPEQCRRLAKTAVEAFGGIDYLVLNAGLSMWSRFDQISEPGVFRKIMETNYLGSVYCVQAALPQLRRSGGTIVAVTSTQAVVGLPNHSAYSASKHAVRGFLEALDLELDGEVRILQVMPGWVKGTNLRSRALKGDGQVVGESRRAHGKDAVTVEELSRRIVRAMETGQTELYVPSKLRFVPWL
ncbi:MAG: SDR family oxidoreductase, partial [Acidobacteriota bacterium]